MTFWTGSHGSAKAKFGAAVNHTRPITAVKQIRGIVTGRTEDKEEPEDSRRRAVEEKGGKGVNVQSA